MEIAFPLVIFLALGLLLVQLAARATPESDQQWMRNLLLAALLIRLVVATAFALYPSLRVFHEDANSYEARGMSLAAMWSGELPSMVFPAQNAGYTYLAGALYFVFGGYQVVLSYFNCLVGTLLVFLVYRLALRFFHPKVGRFAALLVGLLPSMILWSAVALKDALMTLLLVVALSSCVALKERVNLVSVAGVVLPMAAIQSIRFYMLYFVGFAVAVSLILDRGGRLLTGVYKQIFLVLVTVGLFVMLGLADNTEASTSYFSLEQASSYRRGMAVSARSGFDQDVDISTPVAALSYLPTGVAYLLWAPFPWQLTSLRPLLAAPETILWWFLFPATVRGILLAVRSRFSETSALLIFSITLTGAYSLIQGNVGSAFRLRTQILVFLFIFCAAGIYAKRLRRAGYDARYVLLHPETNLGGVPLVQPPAVRVAVPAPDPQFATKPRMPAT